MIENKEKNNKNLSYEPKNKQDYLVNLMKKGCYLYPTYPMVHSDNQNQNANNYKKTKEPMFVDGIINKTYKDAVCDETLVNKLFEPSINGERLTNNVGLNLAKSGMICLDFDNHHKQNKGSALLKEWFQLFPEIAKSIKEHTKNGMHLYFKNDLSEEEKEIFGNKKSFDGVEFKADNAIIYPSYGKSIMGADLVQGDLISLPKELKETLIKMAKGEYKPLIKAEKDEVNEQSNEFETYYNNVLKKARKALNDGYVLNNRNNALFYYGIQLQFLKYTPTELVTELMTQRDLLDHEDEQLPNSEVMSIAKSAQKYNKYTVTDKFAEEQRNKPKQFKASEKDSKGQQINELGFICFKDGTPRKDVLLNFLHAFEIEDKKFSSMIRYNKFLHEYQYKQDGKWIEDDKSLFRKLQLDFEKRYNLVPSNVHILKDGFQEYAEQHAVHPYQDKIKATVWDGKKRVETLFIDYLGAEDNEYNRMTSRKFLVSTMARLFYPGCATDIMPILIGKQGLGKTALLQRLGGDAYVSGLPSLRAGNKETAEITQGKFIVEVGELESMNKTSTDAVKEYLSTYVDYYRKAYDDKARPYPRQFAIIGTTNILQPLHDKTGNRRFLPVYCRPKSKLKSYEMKQSTRWQIFAEAYNLLIAELAIAESAGGTIEDIQDLRLSNSHEKELARPEQEKAFASDPVDNALNAYSELLVPSNWDEFSKADRSEYFKHTQIYPTYPKVQDGRRFNEHGNYNKSELTHIKQVTNDELKTIPLNTEYNPYISASDIKRLPKKISLFFDNRDEWNQSNHIIGFNGKETRGYKRELDQ